MIKKVFFKILSKIFFLIYGIYWYNRDFVRYLYLLKKENPNTKLKIFPQIFDKDPASHTFDKHYVYMDRWAFKKILKNQPKEHVDVGSSIRFLSMVSAVTKLKFVDIRPVNLDFDNFECIEGNILKLPFLEGSLNSISCLHVAEHIGLGRYGDGLDVAGTKKACIELSRVLAPGGRLYFALPIGKQNTYFNAHRVHMTQTIIQYFSQLKLLNFAAINDSGRFFEEANLSDYKNSTYSCGCFEFTK